MLGPNFCIEVTNKFKFKRAKFKKAGAMARFLRFSLFIMASLKSTSLEADAKQNKNKNKTGGSFAK